MMWSKKYKKKNVIFLLFFNVYFGPREKNELMSSSSTMSLYKDNFVLINERFGMNKICGLKSWVCHISRDVSSLLILEWHFIDYLLMAHRVSSKGSEEFLSLRFLILWAKSQVAIHHLAYLMDFGGPGFFLIPNIDSYLVG